MRRLALALSLALAACGSRETAITLTVSGATMASVEPLRARLSGIPGVSRVDFAGLDKDAARFGVSFKGTSGEFATRLAALEGMKNITGVDDHSVKVSADSAAPPSPPAAAKPEAPAPSAEKPPAAPPEEKLVAVEVKKDPLAYKVQQLPGGSIATFDGWKFTTVGSDGTWVQFETHPEGKENEFQIVITAGTPGAAVMNNLFEEASRFIEQRMPAARAAGEAKKATIGGDEARVQDYTLEAQGKKLSIQSIILRKKDVAVSVLAVGGEEAFREYGRAAGITAQSITIKEDPPDPALVGTWALEKYSSSGAGTSSQFSYSSSRTLTIYPNGTFTENSFSSAGLSNTVGRTDAYLEGGNRGRVVKRGNVLTFTYDNGKVWNTDFKFDGGAVWFGKNLWLKQ